MDFYPTEPISPEAKEIVGNAAEKLNLTWALDYGSTPNYDSGTLIAGVASIEQLRKHHIFIDKNEDPRLDPRSAYILAKTKLAETDLILGCSPLVFIEDLNDPALESNLLEYTNHYLELFEKTSSIWAFDILNAAYPNIVTKLLIDELNAIAERALIFKSNKSLNSATMFELIGAAVVNVVCMEKTKGYEFLLDKNKELRSMLFNLAEDKALFKFVWNGIYKNYNSLPNLPKNRDNAVQIMSQKTRRHSVYCTETPITLHPRAIQNPMDDIEGLNSHFWTIDIDMPETSHVPVIYNNGSAIYLN